MLTVSQKVETRRGSAAGWAGVGALMAAGALVFWSFDALPFQDLPEHAALIALRHRFAHSPFDQHFFVVAPHLGPYSLFRFLGELLVVPLAPIGAVRVLATLPLIATPLALTWARRRLHGDRSPAGAYLGIALGFGLMTLFGFASYLLGVAALLVALTNWLELLDRADTGESSARTFEWIVMLSTPLLLLVHGDAFVLFVALAASSSLATGDRVRRVLRLRSLIPGLLLAAWVTWIEHQTAVPAGSAPLPHAATGAHFQGPLDKLSLLVTPTLMTRTGLDVGVGLAIWITVLACAAATWRSSVRAGAHPRSLHDRTASASHARALLGSTAALFVVFLALPHSIGWFGFVDGRLVPLLLLLPIMAIRREAIGPRLELALDRVAPAAAAAMVLVALAASYRFQSEAYGWRDVLAAVPAGARLLYLPIDADSRVLTAHPFSHYDKMVMVDRSAVVGDLWFHQGSAVFPTPSNPALSLPGSYSASDLRSVDWPAYHLGDWDWVLVRAKSATLAPDVPRVLSLAAHRGSWWLYRTSPRVLP